MFDFIIAGAQKCATTSLYEYLRQCESVDVPEIKEIPYYSDDSKYMAADNIEFYLGSDFLKSANTKGIAYVNTMYYAEKSVPRILKQAPNAKFIIVIRDPKERAYSAYKYAISRGWETEKDISVAINPERELTFNEYWQHSNLTYIQHSCYGIQIQNIIKYVQPKNLLVINFNDIKTEPRKVITMLLSYLNITDCSVENINYKIYNSQKSTKIKVMQKIIIRDNLIKKIYQKIMPASLRSIINKKVVRRLENWNLGKSLVDDSKLKNFFYTELSNYDNLFDEDLKLLNSLDLNFLNINNSP